jgi:pimeloyl-ACP methyl ester carboxylesterase
MLLDRQLHCRSWTVSNDYLVYRALARDESQGFPRVRTVRVAHRQKLQEAKMTYALWTVPGLLALIFLTTAPSYLAAGSAGAQSTATTPAASEPPVETGYAPINGLRMYYEIHGSGGTPLVILHGAFGTVDMFGPLVSALAETRTVIAVELQGHGRTADVDRPFTYPQFADDVAALLQYLSIEQADIFGYSMGGYTAQQIAIRHPELVRKLVVASASFNKEGVYPEVWEGIASLTPELFEGSPPQTEYARLAPNPENWPALIEKVKQLEQAFSGWPAEDLAAIEAPTLLIVGDADILRPQHIAEMFQLLGGGVPGDFGVRAKAQLAVLPGTNHVEVVLRTDWLLSMMTPFLDAPMPEVA